MNSYKIVLLDLRGFVFNSTGKSNGKIYWGVISKLNHKYGHDLNIGENSFPDFLKEYNLLTNQDLDGGVFLKSVFDTLEINQELINLIKQRCEIVIVSDNYRENIEYISKRYAFNSWSMKEVYSFDYKMVKSNIIFFKRLLIDLAAYKPEEMLLIDDSPEKLESANKYGISGIRFQSNMQIAKEFENFFTG